MLSFQQCSECSSDGGGFPPHFISFADRSGRRGCVLAHNQRQGILNGNPNTRLPPEHCRASRYDVQ